MDLSLITGITGSGKSTTLDAIIDAHNQIDPAHIVIIASPVEYVHTSKASLLNTEKSEEMFFHLKMV